MAGPIVQAFESSVMRSPDKECLLFRDQSLTYIEVWRSANRLANQLVAAGVRPGDKVVLLVNNVPEFAVAYFAVLKAGAVLVPLNPKFKTAEIAYGLEHSDATALIVAPLSLPHFLGLSWAPKDLRTVVCMDADGSSMVLDDSRPSWCEGLTWLSYSELMMTSDASDPAVVVKPDDPAVIFYTSGTTGRPKGAICTHENCLAAIDSWVEAFGLHTESRSLMVTPYFHNAYNAFVLSLHRAGGSSVVVDSFFVRTILQQIEYHRPTLLFGTPSNYIALLDSGEADSYDLSSVETAVYGAAPMPREVIKTLRSVFSCDLFNAYAQSETCPAISFLAPQFALEKAPSVGKPVSCLELAIRDDNGQELPCGKVGEICCRGPNIMQGYYKMPEVTAETIIDQWLHTGDLGYLDDQGFLHLVDRKGDLIISGGENIYPKEIEDILYLHPSVLEAAVVGVPDRKRGEVPAAMVVPRRGHDLWSTELRRFCRSRMSSFKVPHSVLVLDKLPRNASGKVMKEEVRKHWDRERRITVENGGRAS